MSPADKEEEGLDLSSVPSGMYAVMGGATRLKLRISRPGDTSKWHGYTFVDDGAVYGQRTAYGRQPPGGKYAGKVREALAAIIADPAGASAAYGRLVGKCGVCGRHLEDEQSVARGIGPKCALRFK